MEPMVIVALIFVIYSVYLTAKDLLSDFRVEGLLGKPGAGRTVTGGWAGGAMQFLKSKGQPETAWRARKSATLVPCRQLSYSRQRLAIEDRMYRMQQR